MRRAFVPLAPTVAPLLAALLAACPTGPAGDDDDGNADAFSGQLVDADRGTPLADCAVGVDFADAVRTGADGRFSVPATGGQTVHALCDGGALLSVRLPDGAAGLDWVLPVEMGTGPDLAVQCVPSITGNAENTGLDAGDGSMELRVLTESATGSYSTTLPSAGWSVQVNGFLRVPEGPYVAIAKAFGGAVAGLAVSTALTCDGNGTAPATTLQLAAVPTTSLQGTWQAAAGSTYSVAVSAPLAEVEEPFRWYDFDVAHSASADASGFAVELLDGVTAGAPTIAGCQRSGSGQRVCLFRALQGTSPDLGALPAYVSVTATYDAGEATVTAVGSVEDGAVELVLTDQDGEPVWTGWAPGAGSAHAIVVGAEWTEGWPEPATMQKSATGVRGVVFDYGQGFAPTAYPDGWSNFRVPLAPAFF